MNEVAEKLRERMAARMSFLQEALTVRELLGWPNEPEANASVVYWMYGWQFNERDTALIRAESDNGH